MARNKYPEETVKLILEQSLKLFMEKGYDNTSIQDIIDQLGGLSKGAIYHHFKSKEEIFEAVCDKIGNENTAFYAKVRDAKGMTGLQKLKYMMEAAYLNPNNDAMIAMTTSIGKDPKFVVMQIEEIYELVAPVFIEPIIRQGIEDGSIQTQYPRQLAEVILTLTNIWMNPLLVRSTLDELEDKLKFLQQILSGLGIELLSEENLQEYLKYFERWKTKLGE